MICNKCSKEFKARSRQYLVDGLCSICRKSSKESLDKYRKTSTCSCGKVILNSSRYCNSCSQLKERNHHWKIEKQDRCLYSHKEWKVWRSAVLNRDTKTCKFCGNTKSKLHAHHIIPKRLAPDLMYELSNGITLCAKCHAKIHLKELDYAEILRLLI